jgi:hypothetical protein
MNTTPISSFCRCAPHSFKTPIALNVSRSLKAFLHLPQSLIRQTGILVAFVCLFHPWGARAQVTTDDQVNYVKTVWNITSVSDDAIKAALDYTPNGGSYSGIPYKDWISFLVEAPDIYSAIENKDYRTATRLAGNFGVSTAFNAALADVGLDSVFSIASLAAFPIEIGLDDFANAVKNASFQHQVEFYWFLDVFGGWIGWNWPAWGHDTRRNISSIVGFGPELESGPNGI